MSKPIIILKQLFACYPHAQIESGTVAIYIRLLQDIPADELQIVVDQCIAQCKFLPTVAELRERWHSLTRNIGQMSGEEAWGLVQMEIQRVGSWAAPHFEDDRVAKVIQSMGWRNLCQSDEPAVDRAQFMRIYNQMAQREEQIGQLLPQARMLAAQRGLLPIGDSLPALSGGGS